MSTDETPAAVDADLQDPKEQMRLALQRKQQGQAQHAGPEQAAGGKASGSAHGPSAGKKQFRRKTGG